LVDYNYGRLPLWLIITITAPHKGCKPWFNSWCGRVSLCPWKRPTDMQTETASMLEWYDRHRA